MNMYIHTVQYNVFSSVDEKIDMYILYSIFSSVDKKRQILFDGENRNTVYL